MGWRGGCALRFCVSQSFLVCRASRSTPGLTTASPISIVVCMSLRHALLAELTAEPMSGYDLVKSFDGTVAFVWQAPHSQIYPELRKMETLGLVEARLVPRGTHAQKRVYSVTPAGVEELRRWADTVLPRQAERNPHRLKAAFFEWANPEAVRAQLWEHLTYHQALVAEWERIIEDISGNRVPLLLRRLANSPQCQHKSIIAFKRFAFEGSIARARAEIAWAEDGLSLLEVLDEGQGKKAYE